MKSQDKFERFTSEKGEEHIIALRYPKNGREFVITTKKRIFERKSDGSYVECVKKDKDTDTLFKCTKPPKTDVIDFFDK